MAFGFCPHTGNLIGKEKQMSSLRAAFKLAVLGFGSVGYMTRLRFTSNQEKSDQVFNNWMRFVARTLNVTVKTHGENAAQTGSQILYLPNHTSYADSIVLGNSIKASFVAAKDVAKWPVIGKIAQLRNTVFIEQVKSRLTDEEKQAVIDRVCGQVKDTLDNKHNVVIFPEGTMSDGSEVLKFRPSVMSLLFKNNDGDTPILAQPLAIELESVNGQSIPKGEKSPLRDNFAWYATDREKGTMNKGLLRHIWDVAKTKSIVLNVHFLEPLNAKDFTDHVALTNTARERIIDKLGIKPASPALA